MNAWDGLSIAARERRIKEIDARCGEAAGLLEQDTTNSPHRIRAYILVTFYCRLCGDLHGS